MLDPELFLWIYYNEYMYSVCIFDATFLKFFLKVCEFFIKCELDPKYINKIDDQLEKPHSKKRRLFTCKTYKVFFII